MKLLLYVFLALIFSSCLGEEVLVEDDFVACEMTKSISDIIPIVNSYEELYELSGIEMMERSNQLSINSLSYDLELLTAKGYSRISDSRSMKTMFTIDFAQTVGLEPYVVYLYQWLFVEMDINANGRVFFLEKSGNCGMVPVINDQYQEVTDFSSRGYIVFESGNITKLKTHVFYVISDVSGKQINKYVPRNPENLEWSYYLY